MIFFWGQEFVIRKLFLQAEQTAVSGGNWSQSCGLYPVIRFSSRGENAFCNICERMQRAKQARNVRYLLTCLCSEVILQCLICSNIHHLAAKFCKTLPHYKRDRVLNARFNCLSHNPSDRNWNAKVRFDQNITLQMFSLSKIFSYHCQRTIFRLSILS